MSEKVKTFRKKRNIVAANSLLNYKGNLFVSVGATGEFWRYNGKQWKLAYQLPENQPWVGTTWGRAIWKEELWFAGMEARLDHPGILVHYDGKEWETLRPKLGPEIWALASLKDSLYAIDSKQILKSDNGQDWEIVSAIPGEEEGRCIAGIHDSLFVGTTEGILSYSLKEDQWEEILHGTACFEIAKYSPFDREWLIAGAMKKRGGPYYIFNRENWHSVRIGVHGNVERLKLTTFGKGKKTSPFLFIPQAADRSGPYGGRVGLGRLYATDWSDLNCVFESACAITEAELYDGDIYFGTAWNRSYEKIQGTTSSIYQLSNLTRANKKPILKYRLWNKEAISKDATTDALFCPGYKYIWIGVESEKKGELKIQVDPIGDFNWKTYDTLSVRPRTFHSISIPETGFTMLRLKFDTATTISAFANLSP